MRVVGGTLIAVAALLGSAPVALADASPSAAPAGAQAAGDPADTNGGSAAPQAQVSMLAVTLTAGGAVAAAGSGVALALSRRRAVSRQPSQESG